MSTLINLKQVHAMLMRKSLIEFIREFWDTWDTAPYKENWLVEFQSECFMYSVKHFLPYYIIKDWIDDKTYEGIKNEANAICPVRDKMFQEKHVHNHDWNMPPRHMKSSIMNVAGPAWLCTNVPISVASVSHTANLSGDMNANRLKIFQSDKYKYFYADENPALRMRKASATSIELLSGAEMYSTCQVSFTGFGADCFVAGTKVSTPFGYKEIQDLKRGDIVYSYNTETDSIEVSVIEHTRKINKNETIRVSTSNGSNLESTIDHRYWVIGKGYIPAVELSKGDKLLYNQNYAYLPSLWKQHMGQSRSMQKVYDKNLALQNNVAMSKMWKIVSARDLRIIKAVDIKIQRFVLQSYVCKRNNKLHEIWDNAERQVMSCMWEKYSSAWKNILLFTVCRCGKETTNEDSSDASTLLSCLRKAYLLSKSQQVLFKNVCRFGTFQTYDRDRKFKLQRWSKLSQPILQSEAQYIGKGQVHMSDMRSKTCGRKVYAQWKKIKEIKSNCTSCRFRQNEQLSEQFNYVMHVLSYAYSQECTISKTTRRYDKQVVYDIQVSKNHNFFANDILVHNCIIADDLISADNAAKDKQVLKNALTFFKGTLPTRLNTKNTGVIWHIQQRLAPGDISGTILGDKLMSQVYSHTEIQAISDRDVTFIYPCTGKVKEIHKGDLLWEDRFGDYTEIRFSMGDSIFRTQYQQDARASDSSIVKEEYIHYIEPDEAEMFKATSSMHYASHDCPVKDSEVNDYHGFVEGYGRENQLIITDGWEEHLGYVKEKELLKTLNNMDRSIGQIIEEKANGAALYQDLRMDVPGLIAFDPGTNSKAQRLGLASVYLQSGAVRFVKNDHTDYLISQLIKFPFVVHDDIVDAFSQLVLYHFTQRTAGVYTNCFTYQNIVATSEKLPATNQCIFAASLSGNTIKIIQVRMEKEKFIVCAEWQVTGLEQFEEFYINTLKSAPVFIDASYENALYGIIGNPRIILRKFNDRDRDKSIQLLKVGFYKKKILVEKQCTQTINDISKLRIVQTMAQMQKGTQVIETVDEGFAGCVRAIITTQKGLSGTWY